MTGDKPQIFLKPAELCISDKPVRITTVLGSCISVTMFHPSGVSAICHALQPVCPLLRDCRDGCREPFRYVNCVVANMARQMKAYAIYLKEVEVKLFGGAAMLGADGGMHTRHSVGKLNVKAAMDAIAANGFSLKIADVGGNTGRKIIFNTQTGEVLLKRVKRIENTNTTAIRNRSATGASTKHERIIQKPITSSEAESRDYAK